MFIRNFQTGDKWLPGVISKQTGPVSYIVKLTNGCERCCHQDQLQKQIVDVTLEDPVQIDNPIPQVIGDQNGEETLVELPVVVPDGNEVPAQPALPGRHICPGTVLQYRDLNLPGNLVK